MTDKEMAIAIATRLVKSEYLIAAMAAEVSQVYYYHRLLIIFNYLQRRAKVASENSRSTHW
jgi:hypothetical protein